MNWEDNYTFSRSDFEIFVGNYFYIVIACIWLVLLIWETFWSFEKNFLTINMHIPTLSISFILPLFLIPTLLLYLISSKLAYRIAFNLSEGRITFFLFHRKNPLVVSINDLERVKITWHTYFVLKKGQTIWYQGDSDLYAFLSEYNFPRKWGVLSKILMKKEYESDSSYQNKGKG